ncbi:dual specificity protein phosphatase 13-like isoform X2 [Alosa alosa]|uniref:dual specificity protein phosphatase 13-like isoform X2 n=1 Tax=Alosa alosa TaxID=278164 RepID=UPI0020152C7E|nr:dual specificity protein phosphatase 13-like isoform X2 [Alosa alosa]
MSALVTTEHTNRSGEMDREKALSSSDSPPDKADRLSETPSMETLEEVDEVWPNLFLGDMYMSHDRYSLWALGITHVLNAAHGKMCCKGTDDFYGTTVSYYGVPANDLPTFDLSPFFYPAAQFIHQALSKPSAKVFVHCAVGVSRSAALVLAYLMIHHNYTLLNAILRVKENRWIFPNRGFLRQLQSLDGRLWRERTDQSHDECLRTNETGISL